jgi:hypothetical protein
MSFLFQPLLPAAELLATNALPGYVKIYMGSGPGWVYKPVKVWTGSQWEIKPAKWYDTGTATWKTTSGL